MSDHLGFLITDVSRQMRKRFDERARLIGATRAQWRTLTTLSRHEGATQGTLAELLEVEPITLCRMIDRLAEAGLVERRRDPEDRRAWNIHLTAKARPILEQLNKLADSMFATALEGISEADRLHLLTTLNRLRARFYEMAEDRERASGDC